MRRIEMKKWAFFGVVLGLSFFLSTCNEGSLTGPSFGQSEPTVKAIAVLSTKATYFIGEEETFAAQLTMSDGTSKQMTTGGRWISDNESVAVVNREGEVRIVGEGSTNITCTYQEISGSKQIHGLIDPNSHWSGTYSVDGCTCTGDFEAAGFCSTHGGSGYPIEIDLKRLGEYLGATIHMGSSTFSMIGWDLPDGGWLLEGQIYQTPYQIELTIVCHWTESELSIEGMSQLFTARGMTGSATLQCSISSPTKAGD
jgi:hypothetical protein